MQKQGYKVDRIPGSNQEFIEDITAHATNDRRFISEQLLREADGKLTETDYKKFLKACHVKRRNSCCGIGVRLQAMCSDMKMY